MKRSGAPKTTADQLRDLLRQQAQAASDEAVRSEGQVAAGQVEALGRLARLVEIQQAAQPARKRKRWPAAVLFGGALLIVSLLLFARVRETEIELDLAVSELSFVAPVQQALAEPMQLSDLGVSGLREIELPGEHAPAAADEGDARLRLSVLPGEAGSISLSTVTLSPGDHVWLRAAGTPSQCRLSLQGKPAELRADVLGAVQLKRAGAGAQRLAFAAPQPVLLRSGTEDVDLDLSFAERADSTFVPQISARDLSLSRIDELLDDPGRTLVRRLSTIESGSLYFISLGDRERKLRPGETLHFERSEGEIRTLRLRDGHIELKYHGGVRGLSTGMDASRRSLMPTWLEWLSARHSLSLLWGTALFLYGLATAAFRWLGKELT